MCLVTILGSCRQDSIYNIHEVTSIKNDISFPHYSKEILEVIRFCKYGSLTSEETTRVLRSAILSNTPIYHNSKIINEFNNTDVFVIEIASIKKYIYNNKHTHHILYDNNMYNCKDQTIVIEQTEDEIEEDIIEMKKELNKPIIIVSHLITRQSGIRYNLSVCLEKICNKHNILFINPVNELKKRNIDISNIFQEGESLLSHYNQTGHKLIQQVYDEYIYRALHN
jgi:hypothetical protein